MRAPDETRVEMLDGINVQIEVWTEPSSEPYDGDEPADGAEGWDILVEATIGFNGGNVVGRDSLGSNWFVPDFEGKRWFDEQIEAVERGAIEAAFDELANVASGNDVQREVERQRGALRLVTSRNLSKLERAKALYVRSSTKNARERLERSNAAFRDGIKSAGEVASKQTKRLAMLEKNAGEIFESVIAGELEP